MSAAEVLITALGLKPHPEGGYFRETFRDQSAGRDANSGRAHSTAIYFLLKAGEVSRCIGSMPPRSGIIIAARRWS